MKTMVIDGKHYIQAKPPTNWLKLEDGMCSACALNKLPAMCATSIDTASIEAFGGDCNSLDVVYQEVQP